MAVIFDEKPMMPIRPRKMKTSFITGLILRTGLVKSKAGAQSVMLVITILAFAIMVMMLPGLFSSPTQKTTNTQGNPSAYNLPSSP